MTHGARSASGAATPPGGELRGLRRRKSPRGWWCSTPCTRSRPSRPTTSPCAGTARRASAARARPRSTASRRLMCMTRLDELDLDEPVTVEPMRAFPPVRDLVTDVSWNFRVKKSDPEVQAAPAGRAGRHLAHARRPTWTACRSSGSASSASCARTSVTCCATITCTTSSSARASSSTRRRSRCIRSTPRTACRSFEKDARHRLLQHHQVLHQGVPRGHHDHRQRDHPAQGAGGGPVLRSHRQAGEDLFAAA